MPYSRPALTEINTTALQDIQNANISGVDGLLQRAVLRVLARAMSGLAYEHYGYQDYIARQAVPWTATGEFLEGWAALKAVYRKAASAASLPATFTGAEGRVLPSGTPVSTGNSLAFVTTAAGTVVGGSVTVPITSTGTGTDYNLTPGTSLSLGTVITGINSSGTSGALTTTAADEETDDELRTRMLQVYANPPQGGSRSDYVTWAEAVPGVTRAWCNANGSGAGTVVVYTMFDDAEAANGGFPQGSNGGATAESRTAAATGDQLTVANAIYPLRPVTALVISAAPLPQPISFVLQDVFPSTVNVADIEAALTDLFLRIGDPTGMTLYPSDWTGVISSVAGMDHFDVISPAAPVVIPVGYLPTLGTVAATN
ncbi:baseplate J/gp47 family protein [Lichenicola cladoniae]|uniref:Baseplate J/gp47 family protein n=1 Tax=Lichenicola cladoniae TaxID=1484109 RepID=A0A6M8HNA5_9PROT|nr:baseplate J/gp47 family protein [Lichenicola cladoniae]NPD67310.1 baseplate J/gp47 family protein [Acetobacteraceae bacterium]QKE89812.1 baseplate J/gp47 family protein [Lichenicola cladoniae]